ncbi:MAG: hypothetical protein K1W14_06515 [Muribaculaceae bacterium]
MTNEEIKILAKEYVMQLPYEVRSYQYEQDVVKFLKWLLWTHEIVPKDFIKQTYESCDDDSIKRLEKRADTSAIARAITDGIVNTAKREVLEKVFGSEIFNNNSDEQE